MVSCPIPSDKWLSQSHGLDPRWPHAWLPSSQCMGQYSETPKALARLVIDCVWIHGPLGRPGHGTQQRAVGTGADWVQALRYSLQMRAWVWRTLPPRVRKGRWPEKKKSCPRAARTDESKPGFPQYLCYFPLVSLLTDVNQLSNRCSTVSRSLFCSPCLGLFVYASSILSS